MMRRWIGPTLAACALMCTLAAVLGVVWLAQWAPDGVQLIIDGERWAPEGLSTVHWLGAVLAVACALFVVVLVLGVVLPLTFLVVTLAVAASLGVALLSMLGVAALVLLPLGLLLLPAWLLLRPRTSPAGS